MDNSEEDDKFAIGGSTVLARCPALELRSTAFCRDYWGPSASQAGTRETVKHQKKVEGRE